MTDHRLWKTGASSCWKHEFSEDICRQYAAAGVFCMELSAGDDKTFTETWDYTRNADKMYKTAQSCGVTITSVHLPFVPFETLDPAAADLALRNRLVSLQSELIRAAGGSGIPIAVIHPSGEPYSPEEREERMECAMDTLSRLVPIAECAGVRLAVEDLPRTCLCSVKEEYVRFLNEIPGLWACFDTNHSLQQPNPEFIRAAAGKIITLHVSDYDMVDERHNLPGDGVNDWPAIFRALEEADYNGIFTYEVSERSADPTKAPRSMEDIRQNHIWLNTL